MLHFLFRRLTAEPGRGAELFEGVTRIARAPHWYVEGRVADTLDGRFAILSTVAALVLVRLEAEPERGNAVAVALTERFIEVMESEHRELGLGDPTLGKTVRKLVGALARRTETCRAAAGGETSWRTAARQCLYKSDPAADALDHSARALERQHRRFQQLTFAEIEQGELK